GVRPGVGDGGARARRVLIGRREAVRAGPRVGGTAHRRGEERDGRAFAVRAAVRGGGRGRNRVDGDARRSRGRGAAGDGDGDEVRAGVRGRGVRARRVLLR